MNKYPHVVIVGAGFGGLQTAHSLSKTKVNVTLIDRHNYHTFVPLLYQVATAQLAPEQVVVPIRSLLRRSPNARFLQAEVERIDFAAKEIKTDRNTLTYDFLVLATGSRSQFFGIKGANSHAFPLKTLADAINLRHQILQCFEQAETESNLKTRQQLLTIAIVGGGATGVELAGALVELVNQALSRDYPGLNPQEVTLVLLQSGDRLVAEFPPALGEYTARKLRRLGVKVRLQSKVCQVTRDGLELEDGIWLAAATTIWAIGVKAATPKSFPFPQTGKKRKITVLSTLQLANYPEVFAIGDLANVTGQADALSGVAPEALQQGVYVARTIRQQLQGQNPQAFNYFNKGRLAIIGCYSGIGQIAGLRLRGFLPWLFWLTIHLVYFPNWRNRFTILFTWLHAYIMGDRAVRLILPPGRSEVSPTTRARLVDTLD